MTITAEFRAPLDRVWSLFIDPERWSQWNTEWSEIRDVRGPFDHSGAGYTQVSRLLGREFVGTWTVVECQPKQWRIVAGTLPTGNSFHARETFKDVGGLTRLTIDIQWHTRWGWLGRAMDWFARPLARRQFAANARRAATLLEHRQA